MFTAAFELIKIVAELFGYESREERLRSDEGFRKWQLVNKMMMELHERYRSLSISAIIDELYKMHEIDAVPSWVPIETRGGYLYEVIAHLSSLSLDPEDAERLTLMLFWKELYQYPDRSVPLSLLHVTHRYPNQKYTSQLKEHLKQLEQERDSYSSRCGPDLWREIQATKEAIQLCV